MNKNDAVACNMQFGLCYVMLFSSLPWGFSVADYIKYITLNFNLN